MQTKVLSSVAAATLLFGMTAAMAQSNEHNRVVAQNVQKGRQGPPAAAVSRPAAPVRVAPSIQATPRIQAAPRVVTPSRQVIAPAPRIIQRQTTGQGEVRRNTFTGTTRTTTGAGTANTRVEQNTNLRDQRNLGRRNVVVPPSAVVLPSAGRETTGAGSGGNVNNRGAHATAALSAPQRARLVQSIKESRNLNRVRRADFRVAVGSRVPRRFHLAPLPLAFFAIVPEYRDYYYVYIEDDDDIVIVNPDSYTVVDVLPASAGPGERAVERSRLTFSQKEREIIRRAALSVRSTEGAAGDVDIAIALGSQVPGSITLLPFPDDVYAEIPQLRPLRFVVVHDEVLLVDPDDRRIVAVIN
jgi:hypothetical protein